MKTVIIFGGSGFVGRHLIRRIAKNGYKIVIPYQKKTDEAKLRFLGITGQVIPLRFRSINDTKIINILKKAEVVINLKTQWDEKKITFNEGILSFNKNLLNILKGIKTNPQFIFFSGLGVENDKTSKRSQAIYESEKYILKNTTNSYIIRPGIIIGGEDKFLNNLLPIFKFSPIIPLFGKGEYKFQPVYVDDISIAINKIIINSERGNHIFEFVGNKTFTYRNFYELILSFLPYKRVIFPVPFFLISILVALLEKTSFSPINKEQLRLFKSNNTSLNLYNKLEDLDINVQDIAEIVKKFVVKNI